jgi:hypothetical protein
MLTRASQANDYRLREGIVQVPAGMAQALEESAVAMGFTRQDTVVLATVATDEGDNDEAPNNTRVQ